MQTLLVFALLSLKTAYIFQAPWHLIKQSFSKRQINLFQQTFFKMSFRDINECHKRVSFPQYIHIMEISVISNSMISAWPTKGKPQSEAASSFQRERSPSGVGTRLNSIRSGFIFLSKACIESRKPRAGWGDLICYHSVNSKFIQRRWGSTITVADMTPIPNT